MFEQMNGNSTPILIAGAGGHAKACIDVIEATGKYKIIGLIGSVAECGTSVLGYQVIGSNDMLLELRGQVKYLAIGLGQLESSELRESLYYKAIGLGYELPPIISPFAVVSHHSDIGHGTVVFHGAVINAATNIGICNIINSKALIEHDAKIGNFCHISTGAIVNGSSIIGDGSFIGSGSVVVNNITLPERSFIKSGSRVSRNG